MRPRKFKHICCSCLMLIFIFVCQAQEGILSASDSYRLNTFDTDQHYAIYDKKIKNNFKEYLSILENFLK